mmetsp:Transcript_85406/g.261195  ORF Transcript_85406/g.261195 Transcript_85406/m.261195 type:complete len:286 (+) Transcript_85406:401-1258(+)
MPGCNKLRRNGQHAAGGLRAQLQVLRSPGEALRVVLRRWRVQLHSPAVELARTREVAPQTMHRAEVRTDLRNGQVLPAEQQSVTLQGHVQKLRGRFRLGGVQEDQRQPDVRPRDLVVVLEAFRVAVDCQSPAVALLGARPGAPEPLDVPEGHEGDRELGMVGLFGRMEPHDVLELAPGRLDIAAVPKRDAEVHPRVQHVQVVAVAVLQLHLEHFAVQALGLVHPVLPPEHMRQVVHRQRGPHVVPAVEAPGQVAGHADLRLALLVAPLEVGQLLAELQVQVRGHP